MEAIIRDFGSLRDFRELIKETAEGQFASGYGWVVLDADGTMKILATANQDVPDLKRFIPLLNVDVWEHAYYLQYQNRRADYLNAWLRLINWRKVACRYEEGLEEVTQARMLRGELPIEFPGGLARNLEETAGFQGEMAGNQGGTARNYGETAGFSDEIAGPSGEMVGVQGEIAGFQGTTVEFQGGTAGLQGEMVGNQGEMVGNQGGTVGKHGKTVGNYGKMAGNYGEMAGNLRVWKWNGDKQDGSRGGLEESWDDRKGKPDRWQGSLGESVKKLGDFGKPLNGFGESLGGLGENLNGFGDSLGGLGENHNGLGENIGGLEENFDGLGENQDASEESYDDVKKGSLEDGKFEFTFVP